jgi:alkaline phosphatase
MKHDHEQLVRLSRRTFFQNGTLLLVAAATVDASSLFAEEDKDRLRMGLITDLHYADKPSAGTRHYRETLGKLAEAAIQFQKDKVNFVVELGDLIDAADSVETEQGYLKTINREFSAISKDRHYVLGNH